MNKILAKTSIVGLSFILGSTAFAGGISGGGGNALPSRRASLQEVNQTIASARYDLTLFFNFLDRNYEPPTWAPINWDTRDSAIHKLLSADKAIFEKVKTVQVNVRTDGPCIDPDKNETDGSAADGSICISASRIQEKLIRDEVYVQTIALMAHEMSHLVGLNEDEANWLQNLALEKLVVFPKRYWNDVAFRFRQDLYKMTYINDMEAELNAAQCERSRATYSLIENLYSIELNNHGIGKEFFNLNQNQYLHAAIAKTWLVMHSQCGLSSTDPKNYWIKQIEKAFQSDFEISLETYISRISSNTATYQNMLPDVVLRRIVDNKTLKLELNDIRTFAERLFKGFEAQQTLQNANLIPTSK